jgi:hypothetical protein
MPILVFDALEGLKQANRAKVRWRAAHTLGKLNEILDTDAPGCWRTRTSLPCGGGSIPRGRVYADVFCDPPGRRRLRSTMTSSSTTHFATQTQNGRKVTFRANDTAQSTRAKFAGQVLRTANRHRAVNHRGCWLLSHSGPRIEPPAHRASPPRSSTGWSVPPARPGIECRKWQKHQVTLDQWTGPRSHSGRFQRRQ